MMRTYETMVAYLFQPLTWPSILVILNLSPSSTAVHFWSMYFSSTPLEFVRLHGLFCRSSTSKTGKSRVFSIRVAHDKGNLQHYIITSVFYSHKNNTFEMWISNGNNLNNRNTPISQHNELCQQNHKNSESISAHVVCWHYF